MDPVPYAGGVHCEAAGVAGSESLTGKRGLERERGPVPLSTTRLAVCVEHLRCALSVQCTLHIEGSV